MNDRNKFVAVDFDGTITFPSKYPLTGLLRPECVGPLIRMREKYYLILWTHRSGEDLEFAVNMCAQEGIKFDFINENPLKGNYDSPKIFFDYCIDDKNYGLNGIIDWNEIEKWFLGEKNE